MVGYRTRCRNQETPKFHSSPQLCLSRMAQIQSPAITQERLVIPNKYGEKLVGVLEEAGSKKLVILCHGLRSSKEEKLILNLAAGLTRQGFSVFRFDFSGNGESEGEGEFQFGNYRKERDDLRAVVFYLSQKKYEINANVGHSKGATSVLLYASTYHDVGTVISASGRFALGKGLEERLGKGFVEKIEKDGFIDVKDGTVLFRVTKESLMERLRIDIPSECLSIAKECRFLIVHGTADEAVPVEEVYELAKNIANHKIHIIQGADHCYTAHQDEWISAVVDFLKSEQV